MRLAERYARARHDRTDPNLDILVRVLDAMLEELREEVRRLARQGTRGSRG